MNEETDLDRIRALAEERLDPEARAEFCQRLIAEPALAELADEYRVVHSLTAPLEGDPPACRTTFEDLQLSSERSHWPRRVAAVAAMLFVLATATWLVRGSAEGLGNETGPVVLNAIGLEAVPSLGQPPPPPPGLADYDPRGADGVAWLDDMEAAAWLSEASGRPLLVFGRIQECVMCEALDERVFSESSVVDLAERYIPVRFYFGSLPPAEAEQLMSRGYPFLEVWDASRQPLHELSRRPEAQFFVESMREGLAAADAEGDVATWDELRGLARTFESGRSAEQRGQLSGAQDSYATLTHADSDVYRELGASGLARISADARAVLLRARDTAGSDPGAAAEVLRDAVERYAGTDYAADLRAVLQRLERSGHFPRLRS